MQGAVFSLTRYTICGTHLQIGPIHESKRALRGVRSGPAGNEERAVKLRAATDAGSALCFDKSQGIFDSPPPRRGRIKVGVQNFLIFPLP
jgi:hypothetical protein